MDTVKPEVGDFLLPTSHGLDVNKGQPYLITSVSEDDGRTYICFKDNVGDLRIWHQPNSFSIVKQGQAVLATTDAAESTVKSDGGSSAYYAVPSDAKDLQDLIEAKGMSFARANVFKACYRMGEKAGADALYDINKIIWFAERMKKMIEKGISL